MLICSWNVNSLRNAEDKFLAFIETYQPDIIFIQELRANQNQLSFFLQNVSGYKCIFNSALKPGYAGTALYYKSNLNVTDIKTEFDGSILGVDGRMISFYIDNTFFAGFYVPNGNMSLERQQFKLSYLGEISYLVAEKKAKGNDVVLIGDFNIAVDERDLYAPFLNKNHSGFSSEERGWANILLNSGIYDTFRLFEQEGGFYTWWNLIDPSRERNNGWRFDYFFVSESLKDKCVSSKILKDYFGSDHCPILLELNLKA